VDFRRKSGGARLIHINGAVVERVESFKFLGVDISKDLTMSIHTPARQRLFPLRRLKRFGMCPQILKTFYSCTIESILTGCITAWYGKRTALDHKALQSPKKTSVTQAMYMLKIMSCNAG
jgi:hypothetical protein